MRTPGPSSGRCKICAGQGTAGTVEVMCDTLTTHEGAELGCVDDVRRYGIEVPDDIEGDRCLCSLELPEVLVGHPSAWKRQGWFDGWAEVGPDGRTWFEGYDANVEIDGVVHMRRSDGRTAATLEEIEAARAPV